MYKYPVHVHQESNGAWVTCRDIPEFNSAGDNVSDALSESVDGLISALSIYVDQRRAIPHASAPLDGEHTIHLPALALAKIELWNEMMAQNMRKADLCRALGAKPASVDRLLDFCHSSKLEHVENALQTLGKRLSVTVEPA